MKAGRAEDLTYVAKCYKLVLMSIVVRISDELAKDAKHRSKVEQRSMTAQLEYWARIGKAAEDNPDLPFAFIKETMVARSETESSQGEEYVFG